MAVSIASFLHFYPDVEVVVCFNCEENQLTWLPSFVKKYDQHHHCQDALPPMGVAWKLYPPRLDRDRHELFIDNDIVFLERIPEIDRFFDNDTTLLLEGLSRNYGRFDQHVPKHCINSGIFGCPPGFNLDKYVKFFGGIKWQENAFGDHAASKTFDEQGLVALALLDYPKYVIIPKDTVTNCEWRLEKSSGVHFIGLNRRPHHRPWLEFRWHTLGKLFL